MVLLRGRAIGVAWSMVVFGGLLSAGCGPVDTTPPQAPPDAARLGALFPMSGPRAPVGQRGAEAARLAVKEANDAGGVLGRQVELVVGDDACDAGTAVAAAESLIGKGIVASVGGACDVASVATVTTFRDGGVPMVIPSSSSVGLIEPGYDSVFLITPTVAAEARFTVAQLRRLGVRRLAVVDVAGLDVAGVDVAAGDVAGVDDAAGDDATSDSAALAASTIDLAGAPASGLAVAGHIHLTPAAESYRQVADDIAHGGADGVFFTGYPAQAARLIGNLRAAGFAGTVMLGDGCVDEATFAGLSAAESDGVYAVSLPIPQHSPGATEWAARYTATAGGPPGPGTMQAYDAAKITLDAIRRAGSTDPGAVRAAIAATEDPQALTGPVRFNPDGTRTDPRFLLLQARDNRYGLASVA